MISNSFIIYTNSVVSNKDLQLTQILLSLILFDQDGSRTSPPACQHSTSLNYQLLLCIIDKAKLDHKISTFFKDYLVGRKTKYLWNNFLSPFCSIDIGVRQESTLSSILSALYLSLIFHIFEKYLKILKIPISIISFIDNGLFISQDKFISHSNANLFCSYNIMSSLLTRFRLIVKYRKTKVFYFSRLQEAFNSSSFNFSDIEEPILLSKDSQ